MTSETTNRPNWANPPSTVVNKNSLIDQALDAFSVISFEEENIRSSWIDGNHLVLILKNTWNFGGCWIPDPNVVLVDRRLWDFLSDNGRQILTEHEITEQTKIVESYPDKKIGIEVSHSGVVSKFHTVTNKSLRNEYGKYRLIDFAEQQYQYYLKHEDKDELEARESAIYTILGSGVREETIFGDKKLTEGWWKKYELTWEEGRRPKEY